MKHYMLWVSKKMGNGSGWGEIYQEYGIPLRINGKGEPEIIPNSTTRELLEYTLERISEEEIKKRNDKHPRL